MAATAEGVSTGVEQANQRTLRSHRQKATTVKGRDQARSAAISEEDTAPQRRSRRSSAPTKSPYFRSAPSSQKKSPASRKNMSCIPFPPLASSRFGLAQERLAHDPFRLLVAVVFLNKTRGAVAMPVFYGLIARYTTPEALASAKHEDVLEHIQHLGLQNQRAKTIINLAKAWLADPPRRGRRHRSLHYPTPGDGKDIRPKEVIEDESIDPRVGWEIAHLPGLGAYAFDSWRIFCRDQLRGIAIVDENAAVDSQIEKASVEDNTESAVSPEWSRVLPLDKELRAYLRWRWLKAGWIWDPLTGKRERASQRKLNDVVGGGVMVEGDVGG